jgi:enamine deaminase RidA (YjgF/YER057c/UK114 family)|uniref:Endoribonuclease L-PSP n=1 Tax=uncultured Flavobacteriia bacterium TaxID=212695 RepID=H6RDV8_9BACT|nr:transcriptional regulator [uncultured bacterium]CCF99219.1 endoribonuclease L-PSP [uncultured Flavobacteriia bacterium]|tara:strand:+ start:720 stop:1184 length:465 start_codon:yes stop_codon:yes gene_type:complete
MNTLPSEQIKKLNLVFPPAPKPAGVYRPVLVVGNFLYVSGQGPMKNDGTLMLGRLGDNLTTEEGKLVARQVGLTMLSSIQTHFGSLDKIKRVVKVLGMVNCTPDFTQHPLVVNGFSEIMADVFGKEHGIGVRSAVGMILPDGIPVEVEAMFELH